MKWSYSNLSFHRRSKSSFTCTIRCTRPRKQVLSCLFAVAIACEDYDATLQCADGKTIKVNYAIFGRTQEHVCGTRRGNLDCVATSSMPIVQGICDGKWRNLILHPSWSLFMHRSRSVSSRFDARPLPKTRDCNIVAQSGASGVLLALKWRYYWQIL
jgi:hypothetical protein